MFLFTTASRLALGPTQPPIQWIRGALSLGVRRPGREADHSTPSSAEVKECVELYLHSPNTPAWRGAQLKDRHNFTFTQALWTAETRGVLVRTPSTKPISPSVYIMLAAAQITSKWIPSQSYQLILYKHSNVRVCIPFHYSSLHFCTLE
jgi:hypothetical protein